MIQSTTNENYMLKTYNLNDPLQHKESNQEIDPASKILPFAATCKLFCFNNKISLLYGKLNNKTFKSSLYQLDTGSQLASWKLISYSNLSVSELLIDPENLIPISHKDDEAIVTSVLNDCIVFHVFSKNTPGRKWISATSSIPQPSNRSAKHKIQSCVVVSNFIYCSVLLNGIGARIYKFNIRSLQQYQRSNVSIRPTSTWHIRDDRTLQNCFTSVHKGEVIIICFAVVSNQTVLEIKRPVLNSTVSPVEYRFKFPQMVKVMAGSVIPGLDNLTIVVTYSESESNKYKIKRIDMSSHKII